MQLKKKYIYNVKYNIYNIKYFNLKMLNLSIEYTIYIYLSLYLCKAIIYTIFFSKNVCHLIF